MKRIYFILFGLFLTQFSFGQTKKLKIYTDERIELLNVIQYLSDYPILNQSENLEYKKEIDKSFNTISPKTALAINAVAINEETTETLSLNLFIGKSKKNPGNYVLTDLTPGVQHQRTYEGNNLKDLFEEFDSKNTYPDGILAYQIPANTLGYPTLKGNFTTDHFALYCGALLRP